MIEKKTFDVLHMSCAGCAMSVERILKASEGVKTATVNFAAGSVLVEFEKNTINPEELKKSVQAGGYDLLVDSKSSQVEDIKTDSHNQLKKQVLMSVFLTIPVAFLGMFWHEKAWADYLMWLLSTPVIFLFGRRFFVNAWKQLRHRSANMDTLVAMSTGIAYMYSVFNTLFPIFWESRGLEAHVYFEAAAVVVTFILLGRLLEEKAKGKTSSSIKKLIGLQPSNVHIVCDNGVIKDIAASEVQTNDILLVKPGEKIAVDGVITSGESYVDESMLTGEPIAAFKQKGNNVFAGTINQHGSFQFKAIKVGSETVLSQIIKMVQEAQGSKAPVQLLVDKIASVFVPVIIGLSLLTFTIWNIFGGENGFSQGLMAMVTVLVIACPCALGLATPTAVIVGIGKGAELGILIKDAESLELTHKVNTIILDKTGTITEGKPTVTDIYWTKNYTAKGAILLSIENLSEHPLSGAIVDHFKDTAIVEIKNFNNVPGMGVKAEAEEKTWFAGNHRLMEENNILLDETMLEKEKEWSAQAKTVIWFANQDEPVAILAIADTIKVSTASAIEQLKKSAIEVYMLTGDQEFTAKTIAEAAGIIHFKSGVLPLEKAQFVKRLQDEGKVVAMVGDGINDSAALAQADVSIAMGKGSEIAMDTAMMTIISSDLKKIPDAFRLSRQTVRTIRQNLFWAFIYNMVGIPVAAGILYPFTGFMLNPMIAGAAMALSSISVVSNSLRLKCLR